MRHDRKHRDQFTAGTELKLVLICRRGGRNKTGEFNLLVKVPVVVLELNTPKQQLQVDSAPENVFSKFRSCLEHVMVADQFESSRLY